MGGEIWECTGGFWGILIGGLGLMREVALSLPISKQSKRYQGSQ